MEGWEYSDEREIDCCVMIPHWFEECGVDVAEKWIFAGWENREVAWFRSRRKLAKKVKDYGTQSRVEVGIWQAA